MGLIISLLPRSKCIQIAHTNGTRTRSCGALAVKPIQIAHQQVTPTRDLAHGTCSRQFAGAKDLANSDKTKYQAKCVDVTHYACVGAHSRRDTSPI